MRAALLTGRYPHAVGLATITEWATGYPGNYGSIPKSAATIAEVLKQNGYNTFAVGKWHLTPYTAYTAAGPFDHWPLGMGFEKYYGFLVLIEAVARAEKELMRARPYGSARCINAE
jgi:arylsulfatase A-like enzyme